MKVGAAMLRASAARYLFAEVKSPTLVCASGMRVAGQGVWLACQVGGIRRIIVPEELGYPSNDFSRIGPQPSTFSVWWSKIAWQGRVAR